MVKIWDFRFEPLRIKNDYIIHEFKFNQISIQVSYIGLKKNILLGYFHTNVFGGN